MRLNNLAILISGLLVSQLSFAQAEFRFGLKGSANIGWINPASKTIERDGTRLGFSYGIMADYYFKPNYAINMELLISQINGAFNLKSPQVFNADTSGTVVSDLNYRYDLQYIEVPISLKFRTKEIGYITYWANFGLGPSFLINAKASIDGSLPQGILAKDPSKYRVNDDEGDPFTTNNFDDQVFLIRMPVIVGGGIEYKIAGNTSIMAGFRFSNSFTDMLLKDKQAHAKNNYFSINLGVYF